MRILVMGAGAIGGYLGCRLQQAGDDVIFCARGENLRALQEHGLAVESPRGNATIRVRAVADPRQCTPYDLVIFAVKSYHTNEAARALVGCLAPEGVVLTVQNGIENEARLVEIFGRSAIMSGNSLVGGELVAPGRIVHTSNGWVELGELDGSMTERLRSLGASFERAGIFAGFMTDWVTARWEKLIGNCAFNTVGALGRCPVGRIMDTPEAVELLRRLMWESLQVAHAEGAKIPETFIDRGLAAAAERLRHNRPSTLQDLERGRPLERDAITGAVLRAAGRHRIEVPVVRAVDALLGLVNPDQPNSAARKGSVG